MTKVPVVIMGVHFTVTLACDPIGTQGAVESVRGILASHFHTVPDAEWTDKVLPEEHGDVPVDMPGIALKKVRWLDKPGQNIWHFPRLYVDGSSWVWKFAVSQLKDLATERTGADPKEKA